MQKGKWLKKIILAAVLVMVFAGMCGFSSRAESVSVQFEQDGGDITLTGNGASQKVTITNNSEKQVAVSCNVDTRVKVSPSSGTIAPKGKAEFTITSNASAYGTYNGAVVFTASAEGCDDTQKSYNVTIMPKTFTVSADKIVAKPGETVKC